AAAGQGQVVLVIGEAGIGKSRLLAEFRSRLAQEHGWFEGRCASYGTSAAFHAAIDGLRRMLGIDDRDDSASGNAKIEEGIGAIGGGPGWTLAFVRSLLAVGPGGAGVAGLGSARRRSEAVRGVKAVPLRAAERPPVVVVAEGLPLIDPGSEEYLTFL